MASGMLKEKGSRKRQNSRRGSLIHFLFAQGTGEEGRVEHGKKYDGYCVLGVSSLDILLQERGMVFKGKLFYHFPS